MSISLYSSATVDNLLSPKLSISSISNAATSTLNATAPNTGQALTFDGTDLIWATVGGSGGLTITTLSNSATSTLNATAPTIGQALTFDGIDLAWATVGGGGGNAGTVSYLSPFLVDTVTTANITSVQLESLTTTGTGGSCYIGTYYGGNIYLLNDIGTQTLQLSPTAITFADNTSQSTAYTEAPSDGKAYSRKDAGWVTDRINDYDSSVVYNLGDQVVYNSAIYVLTTYSGYSGSAPVVGTDWTVISGPQGTPGTNGTNGASGAMNPLDMITVFSLGLGSYFSNSYWSVSFNFPNYTSGAWLPPYFPNTIALNLFQNGTLVDTQYATYGGTGTSGSPSLSLNSGDVLEVYLQTIVSNGSEAYSTIPLIIVIY